MTSVIAKLFEEFVRKSDLEMVFEWLRVVKQAKFDEFQKSR